MKFALFLAVLAVVTYPLQTWLNKRFSKVVSFLLFFCFYMALAMALHAVSHHSGISHD